MKDASQMGMTFARQIQQVTETMMMAGLPESLSEMEQQVRVALQEIGRFQLSAWLALLENKYPAAKLRCRCGAETEYQFQREGVLHTVLGTVRYERAYYLCSHCHRGTYPLDEKLGLRAGELSAEMESLTGMTGAAVPFGKGSELFERLTLVSVSPQSLDKATQAMGSEVMKMEAEWIEESQNLAVVQAAVATQAGGERLYGALDATKVHTDEKGEAPDRGWRDLKIGAWFHTEAKPPTQPDEAWDIQARDITYFCDIAEASTFGKLLWATGFQRQAFAAQELIFLGDGADWIWNLVSEHFPQAIQIVDWFHAVEHLTAVADAAYSDAQQRQTWLTATRKLLWEGDVQGVITNCNELTALGRGGEIPRQTAAYFHNHRQRMRYAYFRQQGYHIGSGTIESGAKQIGTQRLKVPGATWSLQGARRTAKARAAFLSGQWDALSARRQHLLTIA